MDFNVDWYGYVQVGCSWVVIDDYLVFFYGSGGGVFLIFVVNGDFDVYDYCVFNDECCNDEVQVVMIGKFVIGWFKYELIMGVVMLCWVVDKLDGISVLVGSGNIYSGMFVLVLVIDVFGVVYCNLDSCQKVLFFSDCL